MSVVIDTSAWIEWLIGSPVGDRLTEHWPQREDVVVPTLVQLELSKWLRREVAEEAMDQALAHLELCRIVPLDSTIALRAAEICAFHKLATADAIVHATALECGSRLLTCDAHFKGLDGVILVPKAL
ncbi:MAG: type II toxin-antitoxin system VapC family toxin [Beijerinckiaceae bacterium]